MKLSDLKQGEYCSNSVLKGSGGAIVLLNSLYRYVNEGLVSKLLTEEQLSSDIYTKDLYLSNKYGVDLNAKLKTPSIKRNLAFYKKSGEPWTQEELDTVLTHCGLKTGNMAEDAATRKYIFDDSSNNNFMYLWCNQEKQPNFKNCQQLPYEDIFGTTQPTKKETHPMPKQSFSDLINSIFGSTQTDYDKKTKFLGVIYNNDGSEQAIFAANSIEDVETKIKSTPSLWGCKAVVYKASKEVSVDVPVVTTKVTF